MGSTEKLEGCPGREFGTLSHPTFLLCFLVGEVSSLALLCTPAMSYAHWEHDDANLSQLLGLPLRGQEGQCYALGFVRRLNSNDQSTFCSFCFFSIFVSIVTAHLSGNSLNLLRHCELQVSDSFFVQINAVRLILSQVFFYYFFNITYQTLGRD